MAKSAVEESKVGKGVFGGEDPWGKASLRQFHLGKELGASQITRPCLLLGHMF